MYDPARATRPYPAELHAASVTGPNGSELARPQTIDIHVFRRDQSIEMVNATATSYRDFDLWINQRYVRHVDELRAGESRTISLWDFWDERGERMNAGGFWRTNAPTTIQLAEIQPAEGETMIGLITIRPRE